ncbi:hypothetical protein BGW80DRAFT_1305860 [Lactifluus volemus]|nr:hypothetical protein BGW80DRAFT_1305860 [Lactifluus volemus]
MPARHFLCCLPLRLGALLISFVQLVFGSLIAAATWYTFSGMRGHYPNTFKWALIANGVYHTLLALTAFIGYVLFIPAQSSSSGNFNTLIYRLIGTLGRKARLLATYSFYLSWSVILQIALSALYLWAFFSTSRETLIERCIDGSTEKAVQDICNNSFNAGKWAVIVGIVLGLWIQIWAAYIVSSYAKQLRSETWRPAPVATSVSYNVPATSNPKYAGVKQDDRDDHIPLQAAPYPYIDTPHSFGHHHLGNSIA